MQDQRPIAFYSQALKGKNLHLSTYEIELLALATVVKKWRSYLLGRPFVVRTNHEFKVFVGAKDCYTNSAKMASQVAGVCFCGEI